MVGAHVSADRDRLAGDTSADPVGPANVAVDAMGSTDLSHIDAFLQALARAARQSHTYPAASAHVVEAVAAAHRALQSVALNSVSCIVTPRELLVAGVPIGRDTVIEHELARRLREFRCETFVVDRTASTSDLAALCGELAARPKCDTDALADRLDRRGVHRVNVKGSYQPVLLDVHASTDACAIAEQDRCRQDVTLEAGRSAHLYPPHKGWVRLDAGLRLNGVTLTGLAQLVDDPAALAAMLSQLAGEGTSAASQSDALERRCEDVARLYAALDPAVARVRLARLATAVLALDPTRRRRLLSQTVLPGLVDGRPEGDLLRDFPDVDLADALSLLLDVETAAPDLLHTALDRLQLPADRYGAIAPLLEQRIRAHDAERSHLHQDGALRERTEQLIRVVAGDVSFRDFAAYDLSTDAATEALLAGTNTAIRDTNLADAQLTCVSQLIALSPHAAERLITQVGPLLEVIERTQSLAEMAPRFQALQDAVHAVGGCRPTVVTSLRDALGAFFTPARLHAVLSLYEAGDEERAAANRLVAAVGASLTPAVVRAFRDGAHDDRVLKLVADHPALFAPAIAQMLDRLPVPQRIGAIRSLALSGRGCESALARQLDHAHQGVAREALAALARVGSEEAAEFVTRQLQRGSVSEGAEDLLWQFPPALTRHCLRTLLRDRRFVFEHPHMTLRLLQRIDRRDAAKLAGVLAPLASLRLRFWNRSRARIGRHAAALLH
jgi:hypothetical protein